MMQEGLGVARQGQGALAGAQDMYGQGTGLVGQGTGLYGLGTQLTGQASDYYRPGAASSFYNPYEQGVVQQTLSDLQERNAKQGIADRSQAVSRGAWNKKEKEHLAEVLQRRLVAYVQEVLKELEELQ